MIQVTAFLIRTRREKITCQEQVCSSIQALGKCTSKVKLMFCFTATAQLVAWAHTHAHTFYTCTHTHTLIPVSIRLWLTGNQGHLQWCHSFFLRQLQSPNTNTERKEKEENWGMGTDGLSVHWGNCLHGTYIQIDMECGRIDTAMDLIPFSSSMRFNLTGCNAGFSRLFQWT